MITQQDVDNMYNPDNWVAIGNPTLRDKEVDPESVDICRAAIGAILSARMDGQSSGKHSPESWQEETTFDQQDHAIFHVLNMEKVKVVDGKVEKEFFLQEAEHALCRLAIAIALYKREQVKD